MVIEPVLRRTHKVGFSISIYLVLSNFFVVAYLSWVSSLVFITCFLFVTWNFVVLYLLELVSSTYLIQKMWVLVLFRMSSLLIFLMLKLSYFLFFLYNVSKFWVVRGDQLIFAWFFLVNSTLQTHLFFRYIWSLTFVSFLKVTIYHFKSFRLRNSILIFS